MGFSMNAVKSFNNKEIVYLSVYAVTGTTHY